MNKYERFPLRVVTAVRNEEKYLPGLASSMVVQTRLPEKWTIVDDGSTDSTPSIIEELEKDYDWIESIRLPNRGFYKRGIGNTTALKLGFEKAQQAMGIQGWGVLDADVTFKNTTVEQILNAFLTNPKLGIYGGEIVEFHDGKWSPPVVLPEDFIRGACKFYRRQCYKDINGIVTRRGWDSIDNIKAAMKGWEVRRDTALLIRHHRSVGSKDGPLKDQYKTGRDAYYIGSDPMLVLVRGLRKLVKDKPFFLGGLIFLSAYFGNSFLRKDRYPDDEFLKFVRKQHRQILLQGFYKW